MPTLSPEVAGESRFPVLLRAVGPAVAERHVAGSWTPSRATRASSGITVSSTTTELEPRRSQPDPEERPCLLRRRAPLQRLDRHGSSTSSS